MNRALQAGRAALGLQWYYYFDELAAQTAGMKYKLAFDALPGQRGRDGTLRRFVMVGGQGVSISRYSRHQDEAWKFLEWFMSPEQQWKWVRGGGKSGLAAILQDPRFLDAGSANRSFTFSMTLTKDYWHLPAYPQLLQIYQQYVHQAIAGELPPRTALDRCATEHEKILKASSSSDAERPGTKKQTSMSENPATKPRRYNSCGRWPSMPTRGISNGCKSTAGSIRRWRPDDHQSQELRS